MPPTATQVIWARILERTGDFDSSTGDPVVGGGGYLEQQITGVWAQYADKAYVAPRLQELYTEWQLLERAVAQYQHLYDIRDADTSLSREERLRNIERRRDTAIASIQRVETMAAANRAPAVGAITATAPIGPLFPGGLDANGRQYGGDPYLRRAWRYP